MSDPGSMERVTLSRVPGGEWGPRPTYQPPVVGVEVQEFVPLAELERLAAENEKLEARIAELEDALAPFVDEYEAFNFNFAPDRLPLVVFEAARSALAPVRPEEKG